MEMNETLLFEKVSASIQKRKANPESFLDGVDWQLPCYCWSEERIRQVSLDELADTVARLYFMPLL